jgi:hypothetical protein
VSEESDLKEFGYEPGDCRKKCEECKESFKGSSDSFLCEDCASALWQDDEDAKYDMELAEAIQRIAVAAGIEAARPKEVADIVCKKLKGEA